MSIGFTAREVIPSEHFAHQEAPVSNLKLVSVTFAGFFICGAFLLSLACRMISNAWG